MCVQSNRQRIISEYSIITTDHELTLLNQVFEKLDEGALSSNFLYHPILLATTAGIDFKDIKSFLTVLLTFSTKSHSLGTNVFTAYCVDTRSMQMFTMLEMSEVFLNSNYVEAQHYIMMVKINDSVV